MPTGADAIWPWVWYAAPIGLAFLAELPGKSHAKEIILFGAHYDSVIGSPGANDNATGVAAVLALARFTKEYRFARTLRFVAFVNEEPPYFQGPGMGSRVYARECAQRGDRIAAMVSLETIGYYSDRSEEHTSELQSRLHLVCRLLLEKKKKN